MYSGKRYSRNRLVIGIASAIGMLVAGGLHADTLAKNVSVDKDSAGAALMELARQTGTQIVVPREIGNAIKLSMVKGEYTLSEALDIMLEGTGLRYEFTSEDSVLVLQDSEVESSADKSNKEVEELVVTGSRIKRNASEMSSQVIVLNQADIKATGEPTLERALRQLPQNFNGATEVGSTLSGATSVNGARNVSGASTINLRGMGSTSSLVLVDGHRIGASGVLGGSSDISGIPVSAIERVEILLDGASAIYGSDAVGGVINIILKKGEPDFNVGLKYGTPSQGGFEEYFVDASGGFSWASGHLRANFQHHENTNLDSGERETRLDQNNIFNEIPLRVEGERTIIASQFGAFFGPLFWNVDGTFVDNTTGRTPPVAGATPVYAVYVPEGADPTNLQASDFSPADADIQPNPDYDNGRSLIAPAKEDTLMVLFSQELAGGVNLSGDIYYRTKETSPTNGAVQATIPFRTSSAPLYSPITGPGLRFTVDGVLPGVQSAHESEQENIRTNFRLSGDISDSWSWSANVEYSRTDLDTRYVNALNTANLLAAVSSADPDIYFNPFGAIFGEGNSPEVLASILDETKDAGSVNQHKAVDFTARGSLYHLPAGDVQVAVGASWRQEDLHTWSDIAHAGGDANGTIADFASTWDASGKRDVESAFAEMNLPVVGGDNALPGVRQLSLEGKARYDSYDNFKGQSTWGLGLVWQPHDDVTIRLNKNTSFLAPTLAQGEIDEITEISTVAVQSGFFAQFQPAVVTRGGNPDLLPEHSFSETASIEYMPTWLEGLSLRAAWHEIDYVNRIVPFPVTRIVPGVTELEYPDKVFQGPHPADPTQTIWFFDDRAVNLAAERQTGIDYFATYHLETDIGEFVFQANLAHVKSHERIRSADGMAVDTAGTVEAADINGLIAIPEYRATARIGWTYQGLSVNLDGQTQTETWIRRFFENSSGERMLRESYMIQAPTKVDLFVSYDFESGTLFKAPSWLEGTNVSLTVNNIGNSGVRSQSLQHDGEWIGFNSSASNPRGRMFYLSMEKTW
ncbi:TonB-dependent receptor [Porticoccaceae bacterium LTM1]|nr:TonB-dependent receptor [Porticoccaceae bacterium LTM1]